MSHKKQRRIQTKKDRKRQKKRRQQAPKPPRSVPPPAVTLRSGLPPLAPAALDDIPIPRVIMALIDQFQTVTQRPRFAIWQDWLESTAAWLQTVGEIGELNAAKQLPPEVQAIYERVYQTYSQISAQGRPAARRQMGQTFTAIFRVLADHSPHLDLPLCVQHGFNPDLLGLAFIASLGYPRQWHTFFPDWASCTQAAATILPGDPAEPVYVALAHGHAVATRLHHLDPTVPNVGSEAWPIWLQTVLPHSTLPIVIDQVSSSTMLLGLAARFPQWVTRNGLVTFTWPQLEPDPILSRITRITAQVYGLNGFYRTKYRANSETVTQMLVEMEQSPAGNLLPLDHPARIYRAGDGLEQPPSVAPIAPPLGDLPPDVPSFSDLFKSGR